MIKYSLDHGAYAPERAHREDAGWDLRTPCSFLLAPKGYVVIDTRVHAEIPYGYVGFIKSKSGLNTRLGITTDGVVDSGYTGSIRVKLYRNDSGDDCIFSPGDKIAQLVILPICTDEMEHVDKIEGGERGDNGFGSTGK